jgi:hypothetical protein
MEQVRVAGEPVSIREWQLSLAALRAKRIRERTGDAVVVAGRTVFPVAPASAPFGP